MTLRLTHAPAEIDWSRRRAATEPAEVRGDGRDDVRLLVAAGERLRHHHFTELPEMLRPGDLVVVNTSATRPAALPAGRGLRLHVSTAAPSGYHVVEVRRAAGAASAPLEVSPPSRLDLPGGARAALLAPFPAGAAGRLWLARLDIDGPLDAYLAEHGKPIRYPYVTEPWPLADYQTIFGVQPGSAEMPSAGRAFTAEIVTRLVSRGVAIAPVLLHTGVSSLESEEPPYPEQFEVLAATARLVNAVRDGGGRVVAVGTTVVRALESTATTDGRSHPGRGWTDLVLTAERGTFVVDGLITGWHEPGTSHLDLLEAVAGPDVVGASYAAALEAGYLWHEFGDLHLLFGGGQPPAARVERPAA